MASRRSRREGSPSTDGTASSSTDAAPTELYKDGLLPGQSLLSNDAAMSYESPGGTTITETDDPNLGDDAATDRTVRADGLDLLWSTRCLGSRLGLFHHYRRYRGRQRGSAGHQARIS